MAAPAAVTIQMPVDSQKLEDQESKEKRFERYEKVILAMQHPETGVEVKDRKSLLKTVPSCFTAEAAVNWLKNHLNFQDRAEALLFCQKLFKEGYLFPSDEYTPIVDSGDQYLRFQTPYFWPSVSGSPTDFDYAVYLVKCNMKKGAKSMKPYELEAFAKMQKKLRRRWEFIVQQASDQINAAKERTTVQSTIFDSQERAYWWVHRPPRKQEAELNKTVMQQEEQMAPIDPRALKAPAWGKGLTDLLNDEDGYKMFRVHIEREHNEENLDFWEVCDKFEKAQYTPEELEKEAKAIWNKYLVQNAPNEVNVPAATRQKVEKDIKKKKFTPHMFSESKTKTQELMSKDIYARFLRSPEYLELMQQAETQGWLEL
eukprot:comp19171_c0_seq1/m.21868 comp19171_c0_seq1/g.21868  ORF comp19171_c0_seq1/g.21868 comp19171_c0_seq1/m.21868 type:complete len:371 (-) comp19171_c0_seq1:545-1657(-)